MSTRCTRSSIVRLSAAYTVPSPLIVAGSTMVIELTCPNWVDVSMLRKLVSSPDSCLMSPPLASLRYPRGTFWNNHKYGVPTQWSFPARVGRTMTDDHVKSEGGLALANRFFDGILMGDLEALEAACAPGSMLWINLSENDRSLE